MKYNGHPTTKTSGIFLENDNRCNEYQFVKENTACEMLQHTDICYQNICSF